MNERKFLEAACEHFLGRSTEEIKDTILHTLEGHLRSILGVLSVEDIYKVFSLIFVHFCCSFLLGSRDFCPSSARSCST